MFLGANVDKLKAMADKLQKFAAKLDQVRRVLEVLVYASIFFGPFGGAIRAVLKIVIRGLKFLSMAARTAANVLNGNMLQQLGASAAGAIAATYVPPSVMPVESTRQIVERVTKGIIAGDGYKTIAQNVFGSAIPQLPVGNTGVTIGTGGIQLPTPIGTGNPGGPFSPVFNPNAPAPAVGTITIGPGGLSVTPGITPGTTPAINPNEKPPSFPSKPGTIDTRSPIDPKK
jgi:hypothetical protein